MSDALQRLIEAVDSGDDQEVISFVRLLAREEVIDPDQHGWIIKTYRGSLDAADCLKDTLLPGWRMKIEQEEIVAPGDDFTACVWPNDPSRREQVFRPFGKAAMASRAFLLAILRAYQQVQQ